HGERRGRRAGQEAARRYGTEGPPPAGRRSGRSVDAAARRRAAGAAPLVGLTSRRATAPIRPWTAPPPSLPLGSSPCRRCATRTDVARRRARCLLGYAGWGPGQLDAELTASAWLTVPPDPALVFETPPGEMWERAIRGLGVDPMALQLGAGIQ